MFIDSDFHNVKKYAWPVCGYSGVQTWVMLWMKISFGSSPVGSDTSKSSPKSQNTLTQTPWALQLMNCRGEGTQRMRRGGRGGGLYLQNVPGTETGTYSDGRLLWVAELVDSLLKGQACFCQNNTLESRAKHNTKFSRPASTKTWRHYRLSKTLEALSRAQPKTWYTISKQCVYTSQAAHKNILMQYILI